MLSCRFSHTLAGTITKKRQIITNSANNNINININALPKTANQNKYARLLQRDDVKVVIATGKAGTGKTLMSCSYALHNLLNKNISKIVITRPTVELEEKLGYMPGTLESKMQPWIQPIHDSFSEYITQDRLKELSRNGQIEIAPLCFIRGRTFHNSWIIVDEAQNITINQMKTLLTRIGQNSKMVLCGDLDQSDVIYRNGFSDFITRISVHNLTQETNMIQRVELTEDDVMRSEVVKLILKIYSH